MKLSVLLIHNNRTSCDVFALLESKIPCISITQCLMNELVAYLPAYDLVVVEEGLNAQDLVQEDVELLVWKDYFDLSEKIDVFLQLQRHLKQNPFALQYWSLAEVLHSSDDAVIYHALGKGNENVAIKCYKFTPSSLSSNQINTFIKQLNDTPNTESSGLVKIYNGGVQGSSFYIIMEYLKHGSLRQALDGCGNKLPQTHALTWFQEIVIALDCVHRKGLIHHDLKIENIMLRGDGSLALIDYGVSKRILLNAGFVREGELYCSPHYVSPEQLSGESCTAQSDLYSLGVIFYELLTGYKPYKGKQPYELMMQHVMAPVPQLPSHLSQYQPTLDKLMAKNPSDRFCCAIDAIECLPIAA